MKLVRVTRWPFWECLFREGFLTLSVTDTWGWIVLCGGGCPVHYTMFVSIPCLYPQNSNSTSFSCDNRKCPQMSSTLISIGLSVKIWRKWGREPHRDLDRSWAGPIDQGVTRLGPTPNPQVTYIKQISSHVYLFSREDCVSGGEATARAPVQRWKMMLCLRDWREGVRDIRESRRVWWRHGTSSSKQWTS